MTPKATVFGIFLGVLSAEGVPLQCIDADETPFWMAGEVSGPLSCPELVDFCDDAEFGSVVTSMCATSCGVCVTTTTTTTTTEYPCVDIEGPTTLFAGGKFPTCEEAVDLGGCESPFFLGKASSSSSIPECPVTCGECIPTTTTTTSTTIGETQSAGCACSSSWSAMDAVCNDGDVSYQGCGMEVPCDGDRGEGGFTTWCMLEDPSCRSDGRRWDYCMPGMDASTLPAPTKPAVVEVPLIDASTVASITLEATQRMIVSNGTSGLPWCSWSGSIDCPASFTTSMQQKCAEALCEAAGFDFDQLIGFNLNMCSQSEGTIPRANDGGSYFDPFMLEYAEAPAGAWVTAEITAVCSIPSTGQRAARVPPPPLRTRGDCECELTWTEPSDKCVEQVTHSGCGMSPPCDGNYAIDINTNQQWPSWCVVKPGCVAAAGTAGTSSWDFCVPTPLCDEGEVVDLSTGVCKACPAGTAAVPNVRGCSDCTAAAKDLRFTTTGFSGTCEQLAFNSIAPSSASSTCDAGCAAGVSIAMILLVGTVSFVVIRRRNRAKSTETALDGWRTADSSSSTVHQASTSESNPQTPTSPAQSLFDRARASQRASSAAKQRTSAMLQKLGSDADAMMDRIYTEAADEGQEPDAEFEAAVSGLVDKLGKSRPPPLFNASQLAQTASTRSRLNSPLSQEDARLRASSTWSDGYIDVDRKLPSESFPNTPQTSQLTGSPLVSSELPGVPARRRSVEISVDDVVPLENSSPMKDSHSAAGDAPRDSTEDPKESDLEDKSHRVSVSDSESNDETCKSRSIISQEADAIETMPEDYIEPGASTIIPDATIEEEAVTEALPEDYIEP